MDGSTHGQIPAARLRLIERVAALAAKKKLRVGGVTVASFVAFYFRGVAEEDLRVRSNAELLNAARAHLEFGRTRKRGTSLIRVYSPTLKNDRYASTHTIIEVVTDDMP